MILPNLAMKNNSHKEIKKEGKIQKNPENGIFRPSNYYLCASLPESVSFWSR